MAIKRCVHFRALKPDELKHATCGGFYFCALSADLARKLAAVPDAASLAAGLQDASPNGIGPSLMGPDLEPLTRADCTAERSVRCRKCYRLLLHTYGAGVGVEEEPAGSG
ncbi:MAG: hypothetical protein ACP5VE_07845 [Chthonomonadales bacterium]